MRKSSYLIIGDGGSFGAIFILVVLLTNITGEPQGQSVLLPRLPGAGDYLNKIIVLPRGHNSTLVTLNDLKTNKPLVVCTVTKETGFRLHAGNCSLPTLEPGFVLVTSVKVTVLISFGRNSLVLPDTDYIGEEYLLITERSGETEAVLSRFYIYPSRENTTVRLCQRRDTAARRMDNVVAISPGIPQARNCSYINLTNYEGSVLNYTSDLQGMEISANFPFGILEWYICNSSHDVGNRLPSIDSKGQLSPIIWRIYPPLKAWGKTFLWPKDNTSRKLTLISETSNADVFLSSNNSNVILVNNPHYTTIDMNTSDWFYINSTERLLVRDSVQSMDTTYGLTWQYMIPLDVFSKNKATIAPSYQWIYIPYSTNFTILCENSMNKSSYLFDTEANLQEPTVLNVSDLRYSSKHYSLVKGLYSLHFYTDCLLVGADDIAISLMATFPLTITSSLTVTNAGNKTKQVKIDSKIVTKARDRLPQQLLLRTKLSPNQTLDGMATPISVTDAHVYIPDHLDTMPIATIENSNGEAGHIEEKQQFDQNNYRMSLRSSSNSTNLTFPLNTEDNVVTNILNERSDIMRNAFNKKGEVTFQLTSHKSDQTINELSTPGLLLQYINQQRRNISGVATQRKHPRLSGEANVTSSYGTSTVTNNIAASSQSIPVTQVDVSDSKTQPKASDELISNDRFNAVVDIIHGEGDHIESGTLYTDQHTVVLSQQNPTYVHKNDNNDYLSDTQSDKSFMAIIISLCTALVAVVGIIVIFLLIEFFSKRSQIRKTRIRPFVSYY